MSEGSLGPPRSLGQLWRLRRLVDACAGEDSAGAGDARPPHRRSRALPGEGTSQKNAKRQTVPPSVPLSLSLFAPALSPSAIRVSSGPPAVNCPRSVAVKTRVPAWKSRLAVTTPNHSQTRALHFSYIRSSQTGSVSRDNTYQCLCNAPRIATDVYGAQCTDVERDAVREGGF